MTGCHCRGFLEAWAGRSAVQRAGSYYMELCVADGFKAEAEQLMSREGFFAQLPPMKGIDRSFFPFKLLPTRYSFYMLCLLPFIMYACMYVCRCIGGRP